MQPQSEEPEPVADAEPKEMSASSVEDDETLYLQRSPENAQRLRQAIEELNAIQNKASRKS